MKFIPTLIPRSLFWRLVLVWLACFMLMQGISFCDATKRSDQFFFKVFVDTEARLISLQARIFMDKSPALRAVLAEQISRKGKLEIDLSSTPPVLEATDIAFKRLSGQLRDSLVASLQPYGLDYADVRAEVKILRQPTSDSERESPRQAPDESIFSSMRIRMAVLNAAFRLPDGQWLSISHRVEALPNTAFHFGLSRFAGELLLMIMLALTTVFWIIRPLRHLAHATENFGWDLNTAPLPEDKGSIEVRDAARAFNSMRGRIRTFVQERAHMLGAVSHDLRTPLTRIRLRLEGVRDETLRDQLKKDVEEVMQSLEVALSLSRSMNAAETPEQPDRVDLTALLESLADDRQDMGQDVKVIRSFPEPVLLPPMTVRHCLNNLVDNAVRYGGNAEISAILISLPYENAVRRVSAKNPLRRLLQKLRGGASADGSRPESDRRRVRVRIEIADNGPGIPEAEFERVFMPFFRLEPSRNPKTGGHGLGLAIARALARHTGGDVTLVNRPEGGLRAILTLGGETDA